MQREQQLGLAHNDPTASGMELQQEVMEDQFRFQEEEKAKRLENEHNVPTARSRICAWC